ncbi:MBL fold metallo-hydrolase [Schnuerera sp. xch1]|uniref:MBL fold metallo-hydrolase n=1 Tax=Schnuerera sp. xch1 TaxID=2874283 RepID=UPI001CBDEA06|nr:MBL fold metallo-hydrolase [Schnuerera sp. xch1]MBZ2174547.1 MBL fold metallo-hydrolase [Schnuerera sp. xch1]
MKRKLILFIALILSISSISAACVNETFGENNNPTEAEDIEVHFIDVGQADSILIKSSTGKNMLIDAGNNDDEDLIYSYLKDKGIETLDVVVGTHPHEDHIGGLDTVINNFDVKKIYMPKVSNNTKTFEDVLLATKNKGLKITTPTSGDNFELGNAKCTMLAPNSSTYDELNNYSIVIKLEYEDTSFLFTGDAEGISEQEMLNKGYDLSADVLKVGHHGSESSTTELFLEAVSPKHAVIMVGKDNSYGHPHDIILQRLKENNINVYRTDKSETIIATTDGKDITIDKNALDIELNNKSDIIIQNIDKKSETVTIKNNSSEDVNLDSWKIISIKGNQEYTFPAYTLKAGESVTVASGDEEGDLIWGQGNIWNNSESDPGELYDNLGNLIHRYED